MFCPNCGKDAGESKFCPECGKEVANISQPTVNTAIICPSCGSNNVSFQAFQENSGSTTITKGKSKYKEKGHGLIWWLFIGWWWWVVDIFLWIFAFPLKLLSKLFHKKKYKGKSTSVSETVNHVHYKTMCTCNSCGHIWEKAEINNSSSK